MYSTLACFFLSFFSSILLIPFLIHLLASQKIYNPSHTAQLDSIKHQHEMKKTTPSMGGIAIIISGLLGSIWFVNLQSWVTIALYSSVLLLGSVGFYDDLTKALYKNEKGIRAKTKMISQLLTGGIVFFALTKSSTIAYYLPGSVEPYFIFSGLSLIVAFLFTLFIVAGTSNAVNLTDGLDGLATVLSIMVMGVLILVAFASFHPHLTPLKVPVVENAVDIFHILVGFLGALLGFFLFNQHPAKIFMGDTGSLAIGGLIAASSILLRQEMLLALIGGVFVVETLSVIIQVFVYRRTKQRVFLCSPLHHHFEFKGMTEKQVVLRFSFAGLLLAFFGIYLLLW